MFNSGPGVEVMEDAIRRFMDSLKHRNMEASRNYTKFLDACLCQQPREVKEGHTLRQWRDTFSQ